MESDEPGTCIDWISIWALDLNGNCPQSQGGIYGDEWNQTLSGYYGSQTGNGKAFFKAKAHVSPESAHDEEEMIYKITYLVEHITFSTPVTYTTVFGNDETLTWQDGSHPLFVKFDECTLDITDSLCSSTPPNKKGLVGAITIDIESEELNDPDCNCTLSLDKQPIVYCDNGFRDITVEALPPTVYLGGAEIEILAHTFGQWNSPVVLQIHNARFGIHYGNAVTWQIPQREVPKTVHVTAEVTDDSGKSLASTTYDIDEL